MMKNKIMSFILSVVGTVMVIGGLYLLISYLSFLGKAAIDFVSANNVDTISRCGIVVPDLFIQLRDQFATVIIPVLYLGIPAAVILLSIIWFFSGYYFGRYSVQEDLELERKKKQEIKHEVEKRLQGKGKKGPSKMQEEPEEEESEEEEEDEEEEEEEPEEEEKPKRKRR